MKIRAFFPLLVWCATAVGCAKTNAVVEVPNGYTGWVVVHHSAPDCDRADKGNWFQSIIEIQANGRGCSARWRGIDKYSFIFFFYVDTSGRRTRELKHTGWGDGGEIWGEANRSDRHEYIFFVGPEASFKGVPPPS